MNRRLNTIAFLAGATVLNLVLLFFFFLGFSGIAGIFVPVRTGFVAVGFWIGLFLLSLMATWFTYRWALALLRERFPIDRYLDSRIFKGKL
ncbi:MAG: hypothetical protein WCG80_03845 [Spirochaetales bacterium]